MIPWNELPVEYTGFRGTEIGAIVRYVAEMIHGRFEMPLIYMLIAELESEPIG